jgi:hypothetical protein
MAQLEKVRLSHSSMRHQMWTVYPEMKKFMYLYVLN